MHYLVYITKLQNKYKNYLLNLKYNNITFIIILH